MSPSRARRSQARFNPLLAGLLILLAVVGAVVTLDATGVSDTGLLRLLKGREAQASTRNLVPVLFPVRAMQPGHAVSRSDVWDVQAKRLRAVPMDKDLVTDNHYATGLNQIKGRVLAKAKSPNEPFQVEDFLPKGTPAGLVGLVPEGLLLLTISASNVQGLESLGFQDRFDLYVNDEINTKLLAAASKALESRDHVTDADRLRLAQTEKQLSQRLLVQGAVVLRPANPAAREKDKDVAVAVHPDDVEPLLAVLQAGTKIFCVGHSVSETTIAERQPIAGPDPLEAFRWMYEERRDVELFEGNERKIISVPSQQPK